MSHEPGDPKYNRQEPGGPKSDCLKLVRKKIHHIRTQKNSTVPFNNFMCEMKNMQNWNGMHQ